MQTRLIALVLVVLLPTGLVVFYLADAWQAQSEEAAADSVQQLAEAAAVHQENLLGSTALLLEALARTEDITDRDGCPAALARIHEDLPQYGVMGVADAEGSFWCSSLDPDEPISVADRDYFIATRETRRPAVGHYQIGRVTGKPTVALAHPLVGPDGDFAGAVIASVDLSRPAELAERMDLPEGSTVMVYDDAGTVLMRWPEPAGFVGQQLPERLALHQPGQSSRLIGLDGVERIYGDAVLDHGGEITLTLGVPAAAVDAAVTDTARDAWAWLLAIAVFAAGAALAVGRLLVVSPTRRIIETARRIGAGDLTARASVPEGGEFADLAVELGAMAASLEQQNAALRKAEHRAVEERYRGLLDVAADAVIVTDAGSRIVLVNKGAQTMFGITRGAAQGRHVADLLGCNPRVDQRTEVEWTDPRGMPRWADATASVGEDGLTTIILRDVTAAHEAAAIGAALRESDERFRQAQQHSAIGLALVGLDGRWLDVNPALCRILGRSATELSDLTFQDITHPDDLDADLAYVQQLLTGDIDAYQMEKRYLHADGHLIYVQLNGSLVRDAAGAPQYFVAQVQDLTERKRSQELLDTMFQASPDLLAIGDLDGHLLRVNPAWTDRLGWTTAELEAAELDDLVHPDDVPVVKAEYARLISGLGARRFETRMRAKDGTNRHVQWDAQPLPELSLLVANARDVTEEREQQAELERHRRDLERSNAELEEFAYVASHDLSEPLRAISGFASLLEDELQGDLSEDATDYLRFVMDGTRRMQLLINDLLAFSRVGRTTNDPDAVDLNEVAADVLASLSVSIDEAHATIDVGPLPTVVSNRSLLQQLLQNLIANALKFRRPDTAAHVRLGWADTEDGFAELVVEDDGIGIEPRHRERVFRMFQRLHTRTEYPGTGMGLAICAKIVDSAGGRIWIDDTPLGGTAIHLTLPIIQEAS